MKVELSRVLMTKSSLTPNVLPAGATALTCEVCRGLRSDGGRLQWFDGSSVRTSPQDARFGDTNLYLSVSNMAERASERERETVERRAKVRAAKWLDAKLLLDSLPVLSGPV